MIKPIIRINPTEIHISDPYFYDIIYSNTRVHKPESDKSRVGNPGSIHNTPDKDLHHQRRTALASYFARRQALDFTPYIQSSVDKLCHRLNNEYKDTFKPIKLDDVFAAFATDNIIYFVFARSYDFLNYPDFEIPFTRAIVYDYEIKRSHTDFYLQEIKTQLQKIIISKSEADKNGNHRVGENIKYKTVFEEILHSNVPPEELSLSRLHDEALTIVTAGIITTQTTLAIACFHVLNNPSIHQQLCGE